MSAIGELLVIIMYFFLSIPVFVALILTFRVKDKPIKKSRLIGLIALVIPLVLYTYLQFSSHRTAELEYVGIYELTDYPKCDFCILELQPNNHFFVRNKQLIVEEGKWEYKSGGDYWLVVLGTCGQLGTGKYKYETRNNGFTQR